jgi:hypothetical protein
MYTHTFTRVCTVISNVEPPVNRIELVRTHPELSGTILAACLNHIGVTSALLRGHLYPLVECLEKKLTGSNLEADALTKELN